mmetsp:Transcript_17210/g.65684  ORF Transcript_17210/g.65684 Transcript_17210/m.65684 type:complete len:322 (+) Transcript_17210:1025-1990(+)
MLPGLREDPRAGAGGGGAVRRGPRGRDAHPHRAPRPPAHGRALVRAGHHARLPADCRERARVHPQRGRPGGAARTARHRVREVPRRRRVRQRGRREAGRDGPRPAGRRVRVHLQDVHRRGHGAGGHAGLEASQLRAVQGDAQRLRAEMGRGRERDEHPLRGLRRRRQWRHRRERAHLRDPLPGRQLHVVDEDEVPLPPLRSRLQQPDRPLRVQEHADEHDEAPGRELSERAAGQSRELRHAPRAAAPGHLESALRERRGRPRGRGAYLRGVLRGAADDPPLLSSLSRAPRRSLVCFLSPRDYGSLCVSLCVSLCAGEVVVV